jgi:hypothetical protein
LLCASKIFTISNACTIVAKVSQEEKIALFCSEAPNIAKTEKK